MYKGSKSLQSNYPIRVETFQGNLNLDFGRCLKLIEGTKGSIKKGQANTFVKLMERSLKNKVG